VVKLAQDDSHIFLAPEQIENEIKDLLEFVKYVYGVFKFEFKVKLSTRPTEFMGDPKLWDDAEAALKRTLENAGVQFVIKPGEGAFYGPKIDFDVKDSLKRDWQLATIQLDFQLPLRFDATYEGADGKKHTVVMIHRAILGSLERFIGVLIEHTAGRFPLWIAPVQTILLPIADRHADYCENLRKEFERHDLRVEVDVRAESTPKKIRDAQLQNIPLMLTVGDKEIENGTLAVRTLNGKVKFGVKKEDFLKTILELIKSKSIDIEI